MSISVKAFQDGTEYQNMLQEATAKGAQKESTHTFFAGNIQASGEKNSLLEQKRQMAQKQAFQLIGNAWENDQKTEEGLKKLSALYDEKSIEKGNASKQISELVSRKSELQKEYGIDPDSQEQKDLELLQEYQDRISGVTYTSFTKEKIKRLSELQTIPKTEYQKRVLELNAQTGSFRKTVNSLDQEIVAIQDAVRGTKQEQLKSQGMQKAQGASDKIMDAASEEIIGSLIRDGKESIDEKVEEEQKRAEEIEAKKEEEQEKIDKIKESSDVETAIKTITESAEEISKKLNEIIKISSKSYEDIEKSNEALKLIDTTTRKTNILGINANIESARAGELGRGFSVVAKEMMKLASQSGTMSKEIEDSLMRMKFNVEATLDAMNNFQEIVEAQEESTKDIAIAMEKISNISKMLIK